MRHHEIARNIATGVRARRTQAGITRKQLAAAAHVSERYLHQLENAETNATIGILVKIAAALEIDLIGLLTGAAAMSHGPEAPFGPEAHGAFASLAARMTRVEQEGAVPVLQRYLEERRGAIKGLALVGLRGAGKTTLGRRLATQCGVAFVSVTREIEAKAGMSLAELFNLGGPNAYRSLEIDVVNDMIGREGRIVLETAGGIVGNPEALDRILASFRSVWLKAAPEEHLARVAGQGDLRPMRGNPKALDQLKSLLSQREPEYSRSECVIDTAGRSVDDCFAELEKFARPIFS